MGYICALQTQRGPRIRVTWPRVVRLAADFIADSFYTLFQHQVAVTRPYEKARPIYPRDKCSEKAKHLAAYVGMILLPIESYLSHSLNRRCRLVPFCFFSENRRTESRSSRGILVVSFAAAVRMCANYTDTDRTAIISLRYQSQIARIERQLRLYLLTDSRQRLMSKMTWSGSVQVARRGDGIDARVRAPASPMTARIGGSYRGSSIIRMKNDSEVST